MDKRIRTALVAAASIALVACGSGKDISPLNPDKPITVTLWHYYNGSIKVAFDRLVTEFNETVGMDTGIVVDAQSQGDVNQLASAVFDAANKSIGAAPMPDVFASYPDNAFRVNQIVKLVALDQYFSAEELGRYRKEFLEEGRFITDDKLYIMPIAKSSENLYVNKTYWEPFAARHGYSESDLSTWESLVSVAKAYYEETGRAFFGIDANANYLLVAAAQLGPELFTYSPNGTATFHMSPELAKAVWINFYIPYVYGYFAKSGRFSSDDAKTGSVLAYTGSTAGAAYFPTTIAFSENDVRAIEPLVLPYPHFAGGKPVAIQQGAGMCITKTDAAHEYAASLFLKWFTEARQNLKFAVSTGYLPVSVEALGVEDMIGAAGLENPPSPSVIASFAATATMLRSYTLYNSKPFQGSFDMRTFLESSLPAKISVDVAELKKKLEAGGDRAALLAALGSDEAFEAWYAQFAAQADLVLHRD